MADQKKTARVEERKSCQTAFVTRFEAPIGFSFPKEFDLAASSLLFAEAIREDGVTSVYLYWTSADRAGALGAKVAASLGLTGGKSLGEIIEIATPQKPSWRETPARWGQWLITAGAIFGALSVVQDHFTDFLGRPHVSIFANDKTPANLHAGDLIDFAVIARNEARLGHADVHVDSAKFTPSDATAPGLTAHAVVPDLSQLQPAQDSAIHLSGPAPVLSGFKTKAYQVEVTGNATQGIVWGGLPVKSLPFTVVLWPDRIKAVSLRRLNAQVAEADLTIGSGVDCSKGIHGRLGFVPPVPLRTTGAVLLPPATALGTPPAGAGQVAGPKQVEFQTPPSVAFKPIQVRIVLNFQNDLTEPQWNSLQSSAEVDVE
jgi:hypothetical protein